MAVLIQLPECQIWGQLLFATGVQLAELLRARFPRRATRLRPGLWVGVRGALAGVFVWFLLVLAAVVGMAQYPGPWWWLCRYLVFVSVPLVAYYFPPRRGEMVLEIMGRVERTD